MKFYSAIIFMIFSALLFTNSTLAQSAHPLPENAALHYWWAFSSIRDAEITDPQANELNAILNGTTPYDDSKYNDLLEKNAQALEIMARGASISNCEWGVDYGLGDDIAVDYVRQALLLGRLNILYAFHLFKAGKKDEGVRTLIAGLKFSHDIANGGSLYAAVVSKDLIMTHLQAIVETLRLGQLSASQQAHLDEAVRMLGSHGLDWQAAMKIEMQILNRPPWQKSISLTKVTQAYLATLEDPSQMGRLQHALANIPLPLRGVIPNPEEIVEQKQELDAKLQQMRSLGHPH